MAVAAVQLGTPAHRPRLAARRAAARHPRAVLRAALLAVLVLGVVIVALLARPTPSIARQVAEPPPVVVVVGQGETVWDVVAPHVPAGSDRRAYVTEVVALNGIDAAAIPPGTALRLP